jgi:hypothetical protein
MRLRADREKLATYVDDITMQSHPLCAACSREKNRQDKVDFACITTRKLLHERSVCLKVE